MPVRSGGPAPYAPPQTVLSLIRTYRSRGLQTPFTADVLIRAGTPETLVPRVLQSMKLLDLIDENGQPTTEFEGLRRAPESEFPQRLEAILRNAYAEVFQFVDPAQDTEERVRDAFRAFEPLGQLTRMVTLFLALCEAAAIIQEGSRKPAPKKRTAPSRPVKSADSTRRVSNVRSVPRVRSDFSGAVLDTRELDPVLIVALQKLPGLDEGWTQAERDSWLKFFTMSLDFVRPVGPKATPVASVAENGQ